MPWKVMKRDCKQADGASGSYVVLKMKGGGGTEQESCHTRKDKAEGGLRARYANESAVRKMIRDVLSEVLLWKN